jgi:hypothetical protein
MKIKFEDFLNEYGGPNKAVGFNYTKKQTEEYTLNLGILINPENSISEVKDIIQNILNTFNVGEDWFEIIKDDPDNSECCLYILRVALKAYNELEIKSLKHLLEKELEKYPNIIQVAPLYGIEGSKTVKKKLGYTND